jgi:hypothetical protein
MPAFGKEALIDLVANVADSQSNKQKCDDELQDVVHIV